MMTFLDAGWIIVGFLKFGGLAVALAGVAVFGWYFVRGNGRAARGDSGKIPASSWRGPGPILGAKIVAAGFVLQLLSIVLAALLPGRL